jgi:hypothetical protein
MLLPTSPFLLQNFSNAIIPQGETELPGCVLVSYQR